MPAWCGVDCRCRRTGLACGWRIAKCAAEHFLRAAARTSFIAGEATRRSPASGRLSISNSAPAAAGRTRERKARADRMLGEASGSRSTGLRVEVRRRVEALDGKGRRVPRFQPQGTEIAAGRGAGLVERRTTAVPGIPRAGRARRRTLRRVDGAAATLLGAAARFNRHLRMGAGTADTMQAGEAVLAVTAAGERRYGLIPPS